MTTATMTTDIRSNTRTLSALLARFLVALDRACASSADGGRGL